MFQYIKFLINEDFHNFSVLIKYHQNNEITENEFGRVYSNYTNCDRKARKEQSYVRPCRWHENNTSLKKQGVYWNRLAQIYGKWHALSNI
jgi:hypothetical protein